MPDLEKRIELLEKQVKLQDSKFQSFGRVYSLIGTLDSDFLIKTKGQLKLQYGTKFIDLIKDGKLNVNTEFIFRADSVGNKEGIWILPEDEIWIKLKSGDPINIKGLETFLSYDKELELTAEQLILALTNAGFLYPTKEDINLEQDKIVYVIADKQLYIISLKLLLPLTISSNNIINTNTEEPEFSLPYITYDGTTVTINNALSTSELETKCSTVFICDSVKSLNGSYDTGFLLVYKDGKSILCVDNLYVRDGLDIDLFDIYPEFYFSNVNRINSITLDEENEKQYVLKLKYPTTYKKDDIIGIYTYSKEDEDSNYEYKLLLCKVTKVESLFITIESNEKIKSASIISLVLRKNTKLIYLNNGNLDLSDFGRFGNITELSLNMIDNEANKPIKGFGIFSDIGVHREAMYSSDYELADDDNSSRFASTEWVKARIEEIIKPGYYLSTSISGSGATLKPNDTPQYVGVKYDNVILDATNRYLLYTNDGVTWELIDLYIEPDMNYIFIRSSLVSYYIKGPSGHTSTPGGFLCWSKDGKTEFKNGISGFTGLINDNTETTSINAPVLKLMLDSLDDIDAGVIPDSIQGFSKLWKFPIDKWSNKEERYKLANWTLVVNANGTTFDWQNYTTVNDFGITDLSGGGFRLLDGTQDIPYTDLPPWDLSTGLSKSFVTRAMCLIMNKAYEAGLYSEATGWNISYSGSFFIKTSLGFVSGRWDHIADPLSDIEPDNVCRAQADLRILMIGSKGTTYTYGTRIYIGGLLKDVYYDAREGQRITTRKVFNITM